MRKLILNGDENSKKRKRKEKKEKIEKKSKKLISKKS